MQLPRGGGTSGRVDEALARRALLREGRIMVVESPCTGVCVIEQTSGYCRGCLRTLAEISEWGSADDEKRRAVLARLKDRSLRTR